MAGLTRIEIAGVKASRDDHHRSATARGHRMTWREGENARRRGHAYFLLGTCALCLGTIVVGSGYSSSQGPTDARKTRCPTTKGRS